jgi:hypothetical protein
LVSLFVDLSDSESLEQRMAYRRARPEGQQHLRLTGRPLGNTSCERRRTAQEDRECVRRAYRQLAGPSSGLRNSLGVSAVKLEPCVAQIVIERRLSNDVAASARNPERQ